MKRSVALFLASLLIVLCPGFAFARQLSPTESLSRIDSYRHSRLKSSADMQLVYTAHNQEDNLYYILNKGNNEGFVIVSADDCFPALIAYSDEGAIIPDSMPENMRTMLNFCADNIATAISAGEVVPDMDVPAERSTPIANFVTARWDQGWPYNTLTPRSGNNVMTYTGCVATAMAMAMHYHKYPTTGIGSHSYTWSDQTLSADFGNTTYEWDKMLDTYNYNSSADTYQSVATLMYHCGVAVDMIYGITASAANVYAVPAAMVNYFGYDDSAKLRLRRTYVPDQWNQLVYDELKARRPVLYSGSDSSAGGHYFLCSGCDGNDYFYINWGWSGSGNGYFKLNALNVNNYKFNVDQCIITGLKPDDGVADSKFNMIAMGKLEVYYKNYGQEYQRYSNSTQYIQCSASDINYGFYNMGIETIVPKFGVILENVNTGETTVIGAYDYENQYNAPQTLANYKRATSFQIHNKDFPTEGTFKMYPAAQDEFGEWRKIPCDAAKPQYLYLTLTASTLKFDLPDEGLPKLVGSATKPEGVVYTNNDLYIPVSVENVGAADYSSFIILSYSRDDETNLRYTLRQQVDVPIGEFAETTFNLFFNATRAGRYSVWVDDDSGNNIQPRFQMIVKNRYDPVKLSFNTAPVVTTENVKVTESALKATKVITKVKLELPVTCTEGYFYGDIVANIVNTTTDEVVGSATTESPLSLYSGKTANLELNTEIPAVAGTYVVNVTYIDDDDATALVDGTTDDINATPIFQIKPVYVGIDKVVSDSDDTAEYCVYDLAGVLVHSGCGPLPKLAPGFYLVKSATGCQKIVVR